MTYERFVSLHGFFAFEYPKHWTNEIDEAGHYIFSDPNGGAGVLRIITLPNEFEGADATAKMYEAIVQQNERFNPTLMAASENRFIHFTKIHEVSGSQFTVDYWATVRDDKVVLFTYTVQTAMRDMPKPTEELKSIEHLIVSFQFLHNHAHHG